MTYIWQGDKYLGLYFYDPSGGYWRLMFSGDEVWENEQQCMNKLLTGNPYTQE